MKTWYDPDNLNNEISTYIQHILPTTEGWCTPEKAQALANHVLERRPAVCVEIGVFAGRSLFAIALALRANNHGNVLGIDPWNPGVSIQGFETDAANREWWAKCDHNYIYKEFIRKMATLDLDGWVDVIQGTSQQALACLKIVASKYKPQFIDLLHVDGNHSEAQALFDVQNYVPLVEAGGSVWFDDCDWATTKKAQEYLHQHCQLDRMIGNCGVFTKPH